MKRAKFSLSHYRLLTADMGGLIPVCCLEVLPGDSLRHVTSALLRVQPLLAPVMHPVVVRFHHWFVPNRLIWDEWEDFITGGDTGDVVPTFPTLDSGGAGVVSGSLADYLGIPPGVPNLNYSALPTRAYNLIYNEFYRDQDIISEVAQDNQNILLCGWEKDYFTTTRPWPQKGTEVTLPLGTFAPVVRKNPYDGNMEVRLSDGSLSNAGGPLTIEAVTGRLERNDGTNVLLDPNGQMLADLSNATAVSVNTVREAFAMQRYMEARARYGSRYTEYLRYLGVRSSDARLQRPEYLGGGKQTIAFSEVLQTGPDFDANTGVADLKGHGISAVRSRRYIRFFEEHGHVMTLMSVRPKAMYSQAVHKMFLRRTKEDYWQRELEHIGQQEVQRCEVFADDYPGDGETTFGYQDRYAEYRHHPSGVAGEFRSTLNYWHLAREFAVAPTLNSSFINCEPTKRIIAAPSAHAMWVMVSNSIQARRMVTGNSAPRIN